MSLFSTKVIPKNSLSDIDRVQMYQRNWYDTTSIIFATN